MKTVHFVNAAARARGEALLAPQADCTGGWEPERWLGAPAAGGLALPAAHPTAAWVYAPRGVHLGRYRGRDVLVVADTGNHRVLIWHDIPMVDHQPCDVVLGQPGATSEGPAAGGRGTRTGMFLPTGALIHDDRLVIADAWHHRVLIYDDLPTGPDVEPAMVLGQDGLDGVEPNAGRECSSGTMYWPFGIGIVGRRFYVADTGNRRVLGWSGGLPSSPRLEPDVILGQPDPSARGENREGAAGADSFRWPHDVSGTPDRLLVADAGNHRVLGWAPHPPSDRPADLVIGQADFTASTEWPYSPQRSDTMRFPYAVDVDGDRLAVADTANNRVMVWDGLPGPGSSGIGRGADVVLGQPDFAAAGENHWSAVTHDSLCWPYGVSLRGGRMAVADSGNNRVMLWRHRPTAGARP